MTTGLWTSWADVPEQVRDRVKTVDVTVVEGGAGGRRHKNNTTIQKWAPVTELQQAFGVEPDTVRRILQLEPAYVIRTRTNTLTMSTDAWVRALGRVCQDAQR